MKDASPATLRFCGAAGTVTGSRFLVETGGRSILLDCGLFQGGRELRERNWSAPPFRPRDLDAVVLSHAHLDHSGYLPVLVRDGFAGAIHCTRGTRDLLAILLADAARLAEEQASHANRHGWSRHKPALPLFTADDVERAMKSVVTHPYDRPFDVLPRVGALFRRAGHILGSATVELDVEGTRLVHSGDLGRPDQPILRDPDRVPRADVLVLESTYGDRVHAKDPEEELARAVRETVERRGALLIPAFAVGRTQTLIWMLRRLEDGKRIPSIPVFIDSPMANRVSEVTCRHAEDLDHEMRAAIDADRCPLCRRVYHLASTPDESRAINAVKGPLVVIAGSGMLEGGRILHHLRVRLPDPSTTVVLAGFQPKGTRGRALLDGARELDLFGTSVPVSARVEAIDGLSAHADREEILRWLGGFEAPPRATWLVHGEPPASKALAESIRARLGWNVAVAEDLQAVSLPTSIAPLSPEARR